MRAVVIVAIPKRSLLVVMTIQLLMMTLLFVSAFVVLVVGSVCSSILILPPQRLHNLSFVFHPPVYHCQFQLVENDPGYLLCSHFDRVKRKMFRHPPELPHSISLKDVLLNYILHSYPEIPCCTTDSNCMQSSS